MTDMGGVNPDQLPDQIDGGKMLQRLNEGVQAAVLHNHTNTPDTAGTIFKQLQESLEHEHPDIAASLKQEAPEASPAPTFNMDLTS